MGRYIGELIEEVRRDAENEDTSSISSEDFLRYFNYGQQELQALILAEKATIFQEVVDIDLVVNQAEYTIPDNVWLGESIVDVKVSQSSDERDLVEIREISESRRSFDTGAPKAYTRRAGKIYLTPVPDRSQGFLRVVYERELDSLDLRRGTIEAVTVAAGSITANTLDLDVATDDATRLGAVADKYLCVCDKDGAPTAYNIPFTSYNSSSGLFTHLIHALGTGEAVAVGDYVTVGKYSTTHLTKLNSKIVERYLQLYVGLKIFRRDSNNDASEQADELASLKKQIVESYQSIREDEGEIQIDDPSFFDI